MKHGKVYEEAKLKSSYARDDCVNTNSKEVANCRDIFFVDFFVLFFLLFWFWFLALIYLFFCYSAVAMDFYFSFDER